MLISFVVLAAFPSKDTSVVSPSKAALMSAILPGGGQFYTGQPIKGGVLGGLELFFAYNALSSYSKINTASSSDPYFQKFMSNALWFLAVWGYSIIDAYVSAHLNDFEQKSNEIRNDVSNKFKNGGQNVGKEGVERRLR